MSGSLLDASTCAGHAIFIRSARCYRKLRRELAEAQQRRAWARSAELDERFLVFLTESLDDFPEVLNGRMRLVIAPRVHGIVPQVIHTDASLGSTDQKGQLHLVEHA